MLPFIAKVSEMFARGMPFLRIFAVISLVGFACVARAAEDPRIWIVDLSPGHVAFLRIVGDVNVQPRSVELRIAYKEPLSSNGGNVIAVDLGLSCSKDSDVAVGDIEFRKGGVWKRDSAQQLSVISPTEFNAMLGSPILAKTRAAACGSSGFRQKNLVFAKVSPLTETYFALVGQAVHYQVAMALADTSASDRMNKTNLGTLGVPLDKRDAVIAILGARKLLSEFRQPVP